MTEKRAHDSHCRHRAARRWFSIPPLAAGGVAALGLVLTVIAERRK
jgi:hypothetical protein